MKAINWDRKNFMQENTLSTIDLQINRYVEQLDDVARRVQAIWGIGRLETLASPDMSEKWTRQIQKLNTAIQEKDAFDLPALVAGTIRGWQALEDDAKAQGHAPIDPVCWDVEHEGYKIRVVKNYDDAMAATAEHARREGYAVFTLIEVARLLKERCAPVCEIKELFPDAKVKKVGYSWKEGDSVPF